LQKGSGSDRVNALRAIRLTLSVSGPVMAVSCGTKSSQSPTTNRVISTRCVTGRDLALHDCPDAGQLDACMFCMILNAALVWAVSVSKV
jgi:hypothetical protein